MRTIKFRAWDGKEMRYRDLEDIANFNDFQDFVRENVMQFTGLLDKNGKEIYEGDIISWWGTDMREVRWNEDIGGYETHGLNLANRRARHRMKNNTGEIIGNRYENPDLIQKDV